MYTQPVPTLEVVSTGAPIATQVPAVARLVPKRVVELPSERVWIFVREDPVDLYAWTKPVHHATTPPDQYQHQVIIKNWHQYNQYQQLQLQPEKQNKKVAIKALPARGWLMKTLLAELTATKVPKPSPPLTVAELTWVKGEK